MKRIGLVIALITVLLLAPTACSIPVDTTHLVDMGNQQIRWNALPNSFWDALGLSVSSSDHKTVGDVSRTISTKGVVDEIRVTVYGNGSEIGPSNSTSYTVYNDFVKWQNFTYYPHNITITVTGIEDWNNTNQKLQNATGYNYENTYPTATISESDGSYKIDEGYTSTNDTWSSINSSLTVNTSAGYLDTDDTIVGSMNVTYNYTINKGNFSSATLLNKSFYVAANNTVGTGQDDFNFYITNATGTYLLVDGANGTEPNNGTQYTGTKDLTSYVNNNKWFELKAELIGDGADDDASQPDVRLDALAVNGTITKLPSRNISVDIHKDSQNWYNVSELADGSTQSFNLSDSELNLTNQIKTFVDGSGQFDLKLNWNDENRTRLNSITLSGVHDVTVQVDKFLGAGESNTTTITKTVWGTPRIDVDVNTSHTLMHYNNYSISIESYRYMAVSNAKFTVDEDGVTVENYGTGSKPIPMLIKPNIQYVTVNLTTWRPDAGVGATILDCTMQGESAEPVQLSGSSDYPQVYVLVDNITASQVSLWVDGEQKQVLNTSDGSVAFSVGGFSEKNVALKAYSAGFGMAPQLQPYVLASYIVVTAFFLTILLLFGYGLYRKLR